MRSSSIWFNHFFNSTSGWKRKNSFSLQPEVDFFDIARLGHWYALCAFHTKNILFSINCHVAVSGSKFTNGPSKCSQQIGLLPYYHNLLLIFVIFEKKWRLRKKNGKNGFLECWFRNPGEILNLLINFATKTGKKVSTSRKQTLNNPSCPFVDFLWSPQS